MKAIIAGILALILAGWPLLSSAQDTDQQQTSTQYRDVDDGQLLKGLSYILTPFGMALEWGIARPLHYLATQTAAAPALSGDTGLSFFNENHNADFVPPGTFAPAPINPTNDMQLSNDKESVPIPPVGRPVAPSQPAAPSAPLTPGGQPALQ